MCVCCLLFAVSCVSLPPFLHLQWVIRKKILGTCALVLSFNVLCVLADVYSALTQHPLDVGQFVISVFSSYSSLTREKERRTEMQKNRKRSIWLIVSVAFVNNKTPDMAIIR